MSGKHKVVFVHYVYIGNISDDDAKLYIEKYNKMCDTINYDISDWSVHYIIPIREGGNEIKCIYPVPFQLNPDKTNLIEEYLKLEKIDYTKIEQLCNSLFIDFKETFLVKMSSLLNSKNISLTLNGDSLKIS